jgi:hypothetical protein
MCWDSDEHGDDTPSSLSPSAPFGLGAAPPSSFGSVDAPSPQPPPPVLAAAGAVDRDIPMADERAGPARQAVKRSRQPARRPAGAKKVPRIAASGIANGLRAFQSAGAGGGGSVQRSQIALHAVIANHAPGSLYGDLSFHDIQDLLVRPPSPLPPFGARPTLVP